VTTTRGVIENRPDGLTWLVVSSGWSAEITRLVNDREIDGIELNSTKGRWDPTLEFLYSVPRLAHLEIVALQQKDVTAVGALTRLESLKLSTYATSPLDLSKFRALRELVLEWRPRYENLSSCKGLVKLSLNRYARSDLHEIAGLRHLRSFRIGDSRLLSLRGMEGLESLVDVRLFALPKIETLEPLSSLRLQTINIKSCRSIGNVDALERVNSLRRLILEDCGPIQSLRPVAQLSSLREIFVTGDTNIADGDIGFLRTMDLEKVAIRNRRHYTVRCEELPGCI
jgi:hypothetical protein